MSYFNYNICSNENLIGSAGTVHCWSHVNTKLGYKQWLCMELSYMVVFSLPVACWLTVVTDTWDSRDPPRFGVNIQANPSIIYLEKKLATPWPQHEKQALLCWKTVTGYYYLRRGTMLRQRTSLTVRSPKLLKEVT